MHAEYGGIVPEIASRQHMLTFNAVVREALEQASIELRDLDGIAVTYGPGLAGALLVGVNSAKGLALAEETPLVGINHLEGHIYAAWLEDIPDPATDPGFPLLCLIASGGHTDLVLMRDHGRYELVGQTRDDAAGEAFDKAARVPGTRIPRRPRNPEDVRAAAWSREALPSSQRQELPRLQLQWTQDGHASPRTGKGMVPARRRRNRRVGAGRSGCGIPGGRSRQHRHPLRGGSQDLPGSRDRARRGCRRQQSPAQGDRRPLTRARHRPLVPASAPTTAQ